MTQRENCAVPNKKLFGPMMGHISLSKTIIIIYIYICNIIFFICPSGLSLPLLSTELNLYIIIYYNIFLCQNCMLYIAKDVVSFQGAQLLVGRTHTRCSEVYVDIPLEPINFNDCAKISLPIGHVLNLLS